MTSPSLRRRLLDVVPPALTLAGMVATPLRPRGGRARRTLSTVVVGGLTATTTVAAARRWGTSRSVATGAATAAATAAVERVGTATGLPFGRYAYTGALRPEVGGVPVIVPLAWWSMALPAREAARAALGSRLGASRSARVAAGAVALTAWDLFLDPQMVGEGYWRWAHDGRYRGIPLSNFAGWLVTGAAVMAALDVALPPDERPDPRLVAEYAVMGAMEAVGFAAFFRDRAVAVVGGAAMLPIAVRAVAAVVASRCVGRRAVSGTGRG